MADDPVAVVRRFIDRAPARSIAIGGTVSVEIQNVVGNGRVVMVERVDHLVSSERSVAVPMAGVFEVEDGRILAWRDYFDLGHAS